MPPLRSLLRAGRLVSGLGGGAYGAATAEPDESPLPVSYTHLTLPTILRV